MWCDYKGNEYESREEAWHDFIKNLSWARLAEYAKLGGQPCMLSDLLETLYCSIDTVTVNIVDNIVENAMEEYFHDCYFSREEE